MKRRLFIGDVVDQYCSKVNLISVSYYSLRRYVGHYCSPTGKDFNTSFDIWYVE